MLKLRPFDGEYEEIKGDMMRLLATADVVLTVNTAAVSNSRPVQDELAEATRLGCSGETTHRGVDAGRFGPDVLGTAFSIWSLAPPIHAGIS